MIYNCLVVYDTSVMFSSSVRIVLFFPVGSDGGDGGVGGGGQGDVTFFFTTISVPDVSVM